MAEPTSHPDPGPPRGTTPAEPLLRAKPMPVDVSDRPVDPAGYRPLSGMAIAGFAMAIAYALLVLVGGFTALKQGTPLLLGGWSFVPFLAVALSLGAWVQISRSEGTRAGMMLARWGLYIGLFFGVGYQAYYAATYFAVREQAHQFTEGWLNLIRQGRLNQAFLLTQEVPVRQGVNPEDEAAMLIRFDQLNPALGGSHGLLTHFREHDLARVLRQGGAEATITPLGVTTWDHRGGAYYMRRAYRVHTMEGDFTFEVSVQGGDSPTGEAGKRQWHVIWPEMRLSEVALNDLGNERDYLRRQSRVFLQLWSDKLNQGRIEDAYLDCVEAGKRAALRRTYSTSVAAAYVLFGMRPGGIMPPTAMLTFACSLNADMARELYLPGFASFASGFVHVEEGKMRLEDPAVFPVLRHGLQNLFRPHQSDYPFFGLIVPEQAVHPWVETKDGRIQFTHTVQLGLGPRYRCEALIVVEGDTKPADPRPADTPWRIVRIEPIGGADRTKDRQPGAPIS